MRPKAELLIDTINALTELDKHDLCMSQTVTLTITHDIQTSEWMKGHEGDYYGYWTDLQASSMDIVSFPNQHVMTKQLNNLSSMEITYLFRNFDVQCRHYENNKSHLSL